jgi:hypothetical protein
MGLNHVSSLETQKQKQDEQKVDGMGTLEGREDDTFNLRLMNEGGVLLVTVKRRKVHRILL